MFRHEPDEECRCCDKAREMLEGAEAELRHEREMHKLTKERLRASNALLDSPEVVEFLNRP